MLLEIQGLKTHFFTDEGLVRAVDGVDMAIKRGQTLCVVGESGCGKSITARSILQIVERPGRIVEGKILYHRRQTTQDTHQTTEIIDLAALEPWGREIRDIRGKDIAMIFQEPMTSLSPVHTIGDQIVETIRLHNPLPKNEALTLAADMLRRVGIPRPAQQLNSYTFQLSGGMRQRAMIAMALSCNPSLLIADEPTTALDVTTQAQILDLMWDLKEDFGMSILFITHDLGVVAEIADEVAVMYLGVVVEWGNVYTIFREPKHPYTRALLNSIPTLDIQPGHYLDSIRGMVPDPYNRPPGCPFHTRCNDFLPGLCDLQMPPRTLLADGHEVRCWLYEDHKEVHLSVFSRGESV
ncbi:MAG: ABC transporter ATP-binding protein [Caldilineaceae bacterium]|nr:ABC transporter ATP-binding protein [Caldilineaceae bacterium]